MSDPKLRHLLDLYEANKKEYEIVKEKSEQAEFIRSKVSQEGLQLSKQILEHMGFNTDAFVGGIYNFPDMIIPFLRRTSEE